MTNREKYEYQRQIESNIGKSRTHKIKEIKATRCQGT